MVLFRPPTSSSAPAEVGLSGRKNGSLETPALAAVELDLLQARSPRRPQAPEAQHSVLLKPDERKEIVDTQTSRDLLALAIVGAASAPTTGAILDNGFRMKRVVEGFACGATVVAPIGAAIGFFQNRTSPPDKKDVVLGTLFGAALGAGVGGVFGALCNLAFPD